MTRTWAKTWLWSGIATRSSTGSKTSRGALEEREGGEGGGAYSCKRWPWSGTAEDF